MNIGTICILTAFGSGGAALVAYLAAWSGHASARRLARALFALMTASLAVASIVLMAAVFGDDFSLKYVADYSSRDLPLLYKLSAFWGGQEGTLLLWSLLQAALGLIVLLRRDDWEPSVMSFLMVPQLFLMLLLVKSRPFQVIPPPPDGAGLNPLLQDPWMAIHPPIVFLGYAALVLPFAFSLAALARREADAWVPRVLPWVLVSLLTLGLGLFIGGFWAYKVLGWGGYWGWDPVENSSLAPWLVATALLHGILTQKTTGGLRRTNLILAALSYELVIFATYMTRSGVLANFSVHSFTDAGLNNYLVASMAVCAALPAILLAKSWRSMKSPALDWRLGLPAVMSLGMILLLAGTALLVVGTSWPILSGLAGTPSSPAPAFYNTTSLPIGLALAGLLGAAPLMTWIPTTWRQLLSRTAPGLAAGIIVAVLPGAFGRSPRGGPLVLLLLAAAVAALVASGIRVARQMRHAPLMTGAGIAHAGLALMFIGIVTTSAFDRKESVSLTSGEPREVMGHRFTLKQYLPGGEGMEPHFEVDVVPASGDPFVARPIMFRDARRDTTIARPHIERHLLSDLYIAPVSYKQAEGAEKRVDLVRDAPQSWGPIEITFRKFQSHSPDAGSLSVGALVDVTRDGRTEPTTLLFTMGSTGTNSPWVPLPLAEGASGRLDGMQVETGTIHVSLKDPSVLASPETLALDVSSKPFVNALWAGILLVALGSAVATAQRLREEKVRAEAPQKVTIRPAARAAAPKVVSIGRSASPR